MPVHDDLGVRMKTFYEQIPKTKLMRRCPVAIRIDGKAFHTFTRGFQKPFDEVLIKSMQETTKYLCENIPDCERFLEERMQPKEDGTLLEEIVDDSLRVRVRKPWDIDEFERQSAINNVLLWD